MNEHFIKQYILENFKNTHVTEAEGDLFFLYGNDEKFPFATLITKDNDYDSVSNLNRDGIFRLNLGIGKANFLSLFNLKSTKEIKDFIASGIDFTVTDKILPHPTYGNMYWISVLNPAEETFKIVQAFLMGCYESAVHRSSKSAAK